MDPSTNPGDEAKSAAAASPVPTPREVATTPPQTQAPLTHSFHPGQSQDDFDLPGQPSIKLNTSIDGYVILENIGRGGMGVVFKAKQPGSGQLVALKMIRAGIFADRESHARFDREIAAIGHVSQFKNIMPIFHVGEFESHAYYVMPFMTRGNVGLHLKHYGANPREAVTVVEKIARAVHRVHQKMILHRDIKPGNILLDAEGEPFLSDFGLIKHLDGDHTLTTPHQRLGTPAYMSPEQTGLLIQPVDHRTDVRALGVVLYELLTGVRPFTAPKGEETTTLLWRIAHEEPRTPRALAPGIDRNLEAVIMKCLEKQPENRFRSAEELADELKRWLDDKPMLTRPPSALSIWWRKHPVARRTLVAACMFLPALLFAVIVYRHLADPERPLREIQREFAESGRAELMRGDWPRWSAWAFGQNDELAKSEDGFLQITSPNARLLLLAKDVSNSGFTLRAKIRHDISESQVSQVGLFICHSAPSPDLRMPHVFYRCTFNDLHDDQEILDIAKVMLKFPKIKVPLKRKGNQLLLGHVIAGEQKNGKPYYRDPNVEPTDFTPAGAGKQTWREVSITMTANEVMGTIDGKSTKPFSLIAARKRLQADIDTAKEFLPDSPMDSELRLTGGLGLIVARGSASFKDVVVERTK